MTRPRLVTDAAILEATRACAIERGPNVALDVIADRLGVTPPALLKRFGSRRDLMIAALRPEDPPAWVRALATGPDDRPLEVQLAALIDAVLDSFVDESPCMSALSESGIPLDEIFADGQTPPPVRNTWALTAWLERARARGIVQGNDFESVALSLLGALHARVFLNDFFGKSWWRRNRAEYVSDLSSFYARALAPGVAARGRLPRSPSRRLTRKKGSS